MPPLTYNVFLSPITPATFPGKTDLAFSPIAITLISGENEAVLVDLPFTVANTNLLSDWLDTTLAGKKLTTVYITHGHGDHFFGAPTFHERFPGTKIVATKHTIEHCQQQLAPEMFDQFWAVFFPDVIPAGVKTVVNSFTEVADDGKIELEGHALQVIEVGHTDTYGTSVLHVPSLDLVVTGDAVYGHLHQYMMEGATQDKRDEWLAAIDKIAALNPKVVIPSHKQEHEGYGPEHLTETQEYIRAYGEEKAKVTTGDELFAAMKARYPERIGDFILTLSTAYAYAPATA